jgi:signal transduction histidine kinase
MRISIFAKLALTFLVIVAGLVIFLSVSAAMELDQSFAALVKDREDRVARGIGLEVDLLLSELESRLSGMTSNFDFRTSLVDRLAGSVPPGELINRIVELRNIADLDYLWLVSPDGILLAAGHDPNSFGNSLLNPPGTFSDKLVRAISGETIETIGVETISAHSLFVAEVFLPVTMTDRFLGREQIIGVLWGAEVIDADFIARSADLAGAEIVAVAPGVLPLASWHDSDESIDPELLTALENTTGEISLRCESYQLATLPFPGSDSAGADAPITIHLLIPKSDLLARRRTLVGAMAVEAILGGFVAILFAFLISKSITFPIERLKTAVTALASGNLQRRVEVHSRDEVEDLVKAFNTMADELDTNTRRLVEAEKLSAWREVARRLAHEIKNPLSPIKLSIQNLVRVYKGNPAAFENTLSQTSETILEEVDRLKTLADEFSNFARMPKPILVSNDVCDVLKGTVALFDKPEIGATIEFSCLDNIPQVMLDRDAMSRVFTNLIKNAVEAMQGRQGKIKIEVTQLKSGYLRGARITIADQGVGMDTESLKQSFNPYFTTKRGGSGLGLAIVQNIVSEHKGRIRIDSEVNKGTVVTLELPAAQVEKSK